MGTEEGWFLTHHPKPSPAPNRKIKCLRMAADWLADNMQDLIEKQIASLKGDLDMKKLLFDCFMKAQKKLISDKTVGNSGSTALVSIYRNGKIYLANTGDTRAVVFRPNESKNLTIDHRISHAAEKQRLKNLGANIKNGRIYIDGYLYLLFFSSSSQHSQMQLNPSEEVTSTLLGPLVTSDFILL